MMNPATSTALLVPRVKSVRSPSRTRCASHPVTLCFLIGQARSVLVNLATRTLNNRNNQQSIYL